MGAAVEDEDEEGVEAGSRGWCLRSATTTGCDWKSWFSRSKKGCSGTRSQLSAHEYNQRGLTTRIRSSRCALRTFAVPNLVARTCVVRSCGAYTSPSVAQVVRVTTLSLTFAPKEVARRKILLEWTGTPVGTTPDSTRLHPCNTFFLMPGMISCVGERERETCHPLHPLLVPRSLTLRSGTLIASLSWQYLCFSSNFW